MRWDRKYERLPHANSGSIGSHCGSVRSMPVRYDGPSVAVYEIASSLDMLIMARGPRFK
jgi:hypothetical protein